MVGVPHDRHPSRRGHAHAMQARHFSLTRYISRNFGPAIDLDGTSGWFAVAVSLQPSWDRASLRTMQNGQHILLQVTNLFAANTIVLVAQYRPVCHEPFGAVQAAQSTSPSALVLRRGPTASAHRTRASESL